MWYCCKFKLCFPAKVWAVSGLSRIFVVWVHYKIDVNNAMLNVKTNIFCLVNYVTQVTDFKNMTDEAEM